MNDIVLDLDLGTPEEQALWEMAVDFFVDMLSSNDNSAGGDAPDMMVNFWEEQKMQAAAA